jgi:hypothetical protein
LLYNERECSSSSSDLNFVTAQHGNLQSTQHFRHPFIMLVVLVICEKECCEMMMTAIILIAAAVVQL